MKMEIWRNYPLGNKVDLVERLLERGVLSDEVRAITRNRQPGRCCVEGCQAPPAPQMVALPEPKAARKSTPKLVRSRKTP
jgi:4-hydroxybutyryl-CoA dehydratase/vinylacetyl-CoA-Delta-isomerase